MPTICERNQGGKNRYYGDLRDIGGGQHALVLVIRRGVGTIVPQGDTIVQTGDTITAIGDPDALRALEDRLRL